MQGILIMNKPLSTLSKAILQHQNQNNAAQLINDAGPVQTCNAIIFPLQFLH